MSNLTYGCIWHKMSNRVDLFMFLILLTFGMFSYEFVLKLMEIKNKHWGMWVAKIEMVQCNGSKNRNKYLLSYQFSIYKKQFTQTTYKMWIVFEMKWFFRTMFTISCRNSINIAVVDNLKMRFFLVKSYYRSLCIELSSNYSCGKKSIAVWDVETCFNIVAVFSCLSGLHSM